MASHSTSGPPTTSIYQPPTGETTGVTTAIKHRAAILPACSVASPFDGWCAFLTIHTFVGLTGEKTLSLLRYVLMFVESPLLVVDPTSSVSKFCLVSPFLPIFATSNIFKPLFWPDFPRPGRTPCICSTGSRIWWRSTPASPLWPLSPGTKRCNCCGSWKQRCKERWGLGLGLLVDMADVG